MSDDMSERLYQALLDDPGNPDRMRVLSDALEEGGQVDLADTYRWAAERNLWPFRRRARQNRWKEMNDPEGMVYDWDREGREMPLTEGAHLPVKLYRAIRGLEDRTYGGIREAFVLLMRGLEKLKGEVV